MRRTVLLLVLILLLLPSVPCGQAEGLDGPAFRLDMVCPTGTEGLSVKNISFDDASLEGYAVTDGEGTVTFGPGNDVPSGGKLYLMSSEPEEWMQIDTWTGYDSETVSCEGRFNLNDSGDDLYLLDPDGDVIDSFVYGDAEGYSHWDGEPYHRVPKKTVAYRNAWAELPFDGQEWKDHVPGRTLYHFSRTYTDCTVTPVVFPDSEGRPVLKALQDAEESVRISMYTFDNERVASALIMLLDKGVEVDMFLEGAPAGGVPAEELPMLKTLSEHGADIRFIKSADGYKRFDYVHAKYAVIDGDLTVVTSENWTDYAFGSNRGWGAVVEDGGCASYMTEVFERDRSGSDILGFEQLYPTAVPCIIPRYVPVEEEFPGYTADVSTVLSPDYSRETLMSFLDSSEERIYCQQLNVDYDWLTGTGDPLDMMEEKTAQGLDVRLQVDVTYDSPYDSDMKDGYGIYSYYRYKDTLDVRYTDGQRLYHNKGIVSDDRTWIGSMNWTDASMDENREFCVIVDSPEFTEVFAETFLYDWGPVYSGVPSVDVQVSGGGYGKSTVLDASGSSLPFGSVIRWDLDGDGEYDREGSRTEWRFYDDTDCRIHAMTPDGEELEEDFRVHVDKKTKASELVDTEVNESEESSGFIRGPIKYLPLLVLIATIIVLKRIAERR